MAGENDLKFIKPQFDEGKNTDKRANHYAYRVEGAESIKSYESFCAVTEKIEEGLKQARLENYQYAKLLDYLNDVRDSRRKQHLETQKQRNTEHQEILIQEKKTIDDLIAKANEELSKSNPVFRRTGSYLEVALDHIKKLDTTSKEKDEYFDKWRSSNQSYWEKLQSYFSDNYKSQINTLGKTAESRNEDPYKIKGKMQTLSHEILNSSIPDEQKVALSNMIMEYSKKLDTKIKIFDDAKKAKEKEERKKREEELNKRNEETARNFDKYNKKISELYRGFGDIGPYNVREGVNSIKLELLKVNLREEDRKRLNISLDELFKKAGSRIGETNRFQVKLHK